MFYNLDFINDLNKAQIDVLRSVSLKEYTTFKIGGKARYLTTPKSVEELITILKCADHHAIAHTVLGNGSNVLAMDEGYEGCLILLRSNFSKIEILDGSRILAQAGATVKSICTFAYTHSLEGLEFAYGIPGTLGGAVVMNAGAFDHEMVDVLEECTYLDEDLNIKKLPAAELELSYRHSLFSDSDKIVISAVFQLKPGKPELIRELMLDHWEHRKARQPLEYPSAGSTFKRPQGSFASYLIDSCGLKGHAVHGASVSEKHAGFLINKDNASSDDMLKLIEEVQEIVKAKTGYTLECEIKLLK